LSLAAVYLLSPLRGSQNQDRGEGTRG
jgi:hypothetical protein